MNELELTGRARTHIVDLTDPRCALHRDAVRPFLDMRAAAARDGIDLLPVSGFRDFDAQLKIWNEKYRGKRTLYDRAGRVLEHAGLTEPQLVESILFWSAIPGASRHHWGSDVDVIDRRVLPPGVGAKLLPAEFAAGGPFARLNDWLARHMQEFGFFRPYSSDQGGVSPEPWHLSYAPVAEGALAQLTQELLAGVLAQSAVDGREELLRALGDFHRRYIATVDPAGKATQSRYA